eukprot:666907-Hanusia_phi.AAC.1
MIGSERTIPARPGPRVPCETPLPVDAQKASKPGSPGAARNGGRGPVNGLRQYLYPKRRSEERREVEEKRGGEKSRKTREK